MNDRKVSDETKHQLDGMFLPELHQAWWAERLAELQDEQNAATDPAHVQAVERRILDHYKNEHDIEQTRARLLEAGRESPGKPDGTPSK